MVNRLSELQVLIDWLAASADTRHRRIADNIDSETRLSDGDWNDLLDIVSRASSIDFARYVGWCHSHQMRGPQLEPPLPNRLARAVADYRFLNPMYEATGNPSGTAPFGREEDAREYLELTNFLDPTLVPDHMKRDIFLGRHLIWATYDDADMDGDPELILNVGDPGTTGDDVLDRSGLARDGAALEVYVVTYGRQSTSLFTPTVADAADHHRFRPAPASADGRAVPGRTVPPSGGAGIPEVVHEVVAADRLLRGLGRYAV